MYLLLTPVKGTLEFRSQEPLVIPPLGHRGRGTSGSIPVSKMSSVGKLWVQ